MQTKGQISALQALGVVPLLAITLCIGGAGYYLTDIEVYFSFITLVFGIFCAGVLVAYWQKHSDLFFVLFALAGIVGGFTYAQYNALDIQDNFQFYPATNSWVQVAGTVLDEEFTDKGKWRLTLGDVRVDGQVIMGKIRLHSHVSAPREARVHGQARLFMPSPPLIPDGFDFQYHAFFRQLAAVGYFRHAPEIEFQKQDEGAISVWRTQLYTSIACDFPTPIAAVVRALLLGDRQSLDAQQIQHFRQSGLAHLLAISGMHIGMIALLAFVCIRRLCALSPAIVLYHSVHRYAAVCAVIVAYLYVLLTGGSVSMQRAFIMISIIMLGWVFERDGFRYRSLALAAIAVFLLQPHVIVEPSFQMSFSAVLVLMGYWSWRQKSPYIQDIPWILRGAVDVLISSSLIALLLLPLTWGHFQTAYLYGPIANVIAIPWMGILVMPLLMLYSLASLFGVEWIIAPFFNRSIEFLLWWAEVMATIPASQIRLSYIPDGVMTAGMAALLGIFLLRSVRLWLKTLLYLLIIGMMLGYAYAQPLPILIVHRADRVWGWVGERGLHVLESVEKKMGAYLQHQWETRLNLPMADALLIGARDQVRWVCDATDCTFTTDDAYWQVGYRCPAPEFREHTIYLGKKLCAGTLFPDAETFMLFEVGNPEAIHDSRIQRGARPWVMAMK